MFQKINAINQRLINFTSYMRDNSKREQFELTEW